MGVCEKWNFLPIAVCSEYMARMREITVSTPNNRLAVFHTADTPPCEGGAG